MAIDGVTMRFGGVVALDNVSFEVPEGSITGLIGPNGAGKTTLFNCITRLYRPQQGSITFDGTELLSLPAHRISGLGITRTFQNLALFPTMSVRANVAVGAHAVTNAGMVAHAFKLGPARREERDIDERVSEALAYLGLEGVADQPATGLPFGTLKRIEIARCLVARPRMILLDEPAGGLNHAEIGELARLITDIRDRFSTTILLVEHHMSLVMGISEKVVVLDFGRKIADGPPAEVQQDPEVIRAYLGVDDG